MRSIDGRGVLPPQAVGQREGGAITPLPSLRADLPLKGGGEEFGAEASPC
jgi:hypothetical protein